MTRAGACVPSSDHCNGAYMISLTRRAFAYAIAFVFAVPALATQVFYEGFSTTSPPSGGADDCSGPGGAGTYPFAAGWLLRDVDSRTPDAQVSYVNDAWEVREDFSHDVTQCAAFSTSYYSPPGQADDWAWTPAIALPASGATLSWRAVTYDPLYPDGYEVRVMVSPNVPTGGTGIIGNQITNSTVVFSVAAENSSWTSHSVALAAYAGQTIYVGFRNNSNDKFLLLIDDVTIIDPSPDAVAQASTPFASEYSRAPDGFTIDAMLGVSVFNGGGSTLTNVGATGTYLLNGAPAGVPLVGSTTGSLAIGASAPVSFSPGTAFTSNGSWAVRYDVSSDQSGSETDAANNTILVPGISIAGNELARDEGAMNGTLGIGNGDGGEMGVALTLGADTVVEGIRFGMAPQSPTMDDGMGGQMPSPWAGLQLIANLRTFTNKPATLIDTTVPVLATFDGGIYDVAFAGGPHLLTAGTYVVTVSEPISPVAMSLPLHTNRFTAGTTWTNWPTSPFGDWANFEAFGSSFAKTPEVSLLTEMSIFKDGFEVPAAGVNGPLRAWRAPARAAAPARPLRKPLPTVLATGR
jgi:hypothetical protein